MNRFSSIIYICLLTVTGIAGCRSGKTDDRAGGRLTVTATLPPQAALVEAIGGDSVQVNTLIGKGVNPESYEPTIAAMRDVANSDVMLLSGALGFETQLTARIKENNNDIVIVDTSAGIEPIYGTHSHHHHHDGEVCDHDHGESADPHTWTSVRNARIIATNILLALTAADPGNASYYQARYNKLYDRLDSLDRQLEEKLKPLAGSSFLVWHPSLSYLARDYGLKQITIELEGKETSPRGIREIVDRAKNSGARVLFVQADFDSSRAESISNQTGTRVVRINPLDADWESQINLIVESLTEGI